MGKMRKCKVCGCTDDDCRQCIEAQGFSCHWLTDDLCCRCGNEAEFRSVAELYNLMAEMLVMPVDMLVPGPEAAR